MREVDRLVVSDPLLDLSGAWDEIAADMARCVPRGGEVGLRPFRPGGGGAEPAPAA